MAEFKAKIHSKRKAQSLTRKCAALVKQQRARIYILVPPCFAADQKIYSSSEANMKGIDFLITKFAPEEVVAQPNSNSNSN